MPWYQADPTSPTEPPSPEPPSPAPEADAEEWVASDFRVAPSTEGRSTNLTERELAALRYEETMARRGDVS